MVHGLETIKALNDAASGEAVADVRFVMTELSDEAVYIDGKLSFAEDEEGSVSIADLADELGGRVAKITNVMLACDFSEDEWPLDYEDLIPYIDKESM